MSYFSEERGLKDAAEMWGWWGSHKNAFQGLLGGSAVEHLPLAQVIILGAGIKSHIRLPAWSLLLPLPMSLPPSLCLSGINKIFKERKKLGFRSLLWVNFLSTIYYLGHVLSLVISGVQKGKPCWASIFEVCVMSAISHVPKQVIQPTKLRGRETYSTHSGEKGEWIFSGK